MKSWVLIGLVAGSFAISAGCGGGGGGGSNGGGGGNVASTGNDSVFGISTSNQLVSFEPGSPGTLQSSRAISGLVAGENLVAIDARPGTGELYALGATSRVYVVDPATAVATEVGTGPFAPALAGTDFGLDFNPVVDRLRVVSDANQNLRLQPSTGVVVGIDTPLVFDAADPNTGIDPQIVASAFTNDFFGTTSTTLFAIDAGIDALVRQGSPGGTPVSPNSGKLFTVGLLGVDTSNEAGFDISPLGGAFACLSAPGATTSEFYAVNLTTGFAALLGTIGGGSVIRDIAIVPARKPRLFAITTANDLVSFHPATPGNLLGTTAITGLQAGEEVVGIDFRPSTGELIGLGDTSRVYQIDTSTGHATAIGAAAFAPPLSGSEFGVDFNPVPDRLRVVSDADQNLRLNPNTGAVASQDAGLAYAAADSNTGLDATVVASAYTSSFAGASSTTSYGIDSALDVFVTQGSPGGAPQSSNSGLLFTIGSLNVDASQLAGLDVSSAGGVLASITAPAGTDSQLYAINLATGAAGLIGTIGGSTPVRDIAIEPPSTPVLYALTNGNRLVSFLAGSPGVLLDSVVVAGLQAGEIVLSIDFRPATHELFGLGSTSRMYKLDPATGAATPIGAGPFSPTLAGTNIGFDFNPSVDRIRVVSDLDQNMRVHPVTGAVVSVDPNVAYDAGDVNFGLDPSIVACAFSTNFAGTTSTTLYAVDSGLDVLVRQGSPDGTPVSPSLGKLFTVGSLGLDATQAVGFDISTYGGAFLVITAPGASSSQLYSLNLATGGVGLIGTIGGTDTVRSLAAAPAGL